MADNKLKRIHSVEEDLNTHKKNRSDNGSPAPTATTQAPASADIQKMIATAQARAKALAAQAGLKPKAPTPAPTPAPAPPRMSKLESIRARIAAATSSNRSETPTPPVFNESLSKARGGLDVGLHPALLPDTPAATQETEIKKEPKKNPYLAHLSEEHGAERKLNARASRPLKFVEHGKYIEQGANLRRLGQLEKMKQAIEAEAREAEIQRSMEPNLIVPEPPAFEWWDESLISGEDYSLIDDPRTLKIEASHGVITPYVLHPVLVEAPKLKLLHETKPLYLTKEEQKKLRRQKRFKALKEEQVKMTLGLVPKPGPVIKLNNLMSVLGNKAVADPTAMEAEVLQGIKDRRDKHEATNLERQLTKEQKHAKLEANQEKDAKQGIFMHVYRIDTLASGKHHFQVSKNAQQSNLTGICILNPKCSLVIVEGGAHSMKFYKKLMLNRVKWTVNEGVKSGFSNGKDQSEDPEWLKPLDESGNPKDFSHNTCTLLFEGPIKARQYRVWLNTRICETDVEAKNSLSRYKLENFWAMAINQSNDEFDA